MRNSFGSGLTEFGNSPNATPIPLASVIWEKVWPSRSTPPQESVSSERKPVHEPEPYSMSKT